VITISRVGALSRYRRPARKSSPRARPALARS
jgi:hypothetical protein